LKIVNLATRSLNYMPASKYSNDNIYEENVCLEHRFLRGIGTFY